MEALTNPDAPVPLRVVAAALVLPDARVLWQRRGNDADAGGLWELPGGKVEPGERPRQALARELAEELAIDVGEAEIGLPLAVSVTRSPAGRLIALTLYRILEWRGEPRPVGGQPLCWALPDQIDPAMLPPADRPFIPALRRRLPAPSEGSEARPQDFDAPIRAAQGAADRDRATRR